MVQRSDLIGTWELLDFVLEAEGEEPSRPFGADAVGYLVYAPDGYMSVQISSASRSGWMSWEFGGGTFEENADAAATYLAYAGPFELDGNAGRVVHSPRIALIPNWAGGDQVRTCDLTDGVLTLSTARSSAGAAVLRASSGGGGPPGPPRPPS